MTASFNKSAISKVFLQRMDTGEYEEIDPNFSTITSLSINDTAEDRWQHAPTEFSVTGTIKCAAEVRNALIKAVSPMQNLLSAVRDGQSVYGHNSHLEMAYGLYETIQYICHRDFGCNLKRFFQENRIKIKVKYQTKNGYWVWMK